MLTFADLNFTIASVLTGEPFDRAFVEENLSVLAKKLKAPEEFRTRLLVPPANVIDQWWESRLALCRCADGIAGPFVASISHTKGITLAAIRPATDGILGIGIDIESADRKISTRAEERIQRLVANSEESELIRWVRYEAAYKACYGNNGMKHIHNGLFVSNEIEIETEVREFENYVVSVAIAKSI